MNEQMITFLRKPWVVPAAVGVSTFVGGLGLGYILGKKNGVVYEVTYETEADVILDVEEDSQLKLDFDPDGKVIIESQGYSYSDSDFKPETVEVLQVVSPLDIVKRDDNVPEQKVNYASVPKNIVLNKPQDPKDIVVEEQPNIVNVFEQNHQDDWDYELEQSTRAFNKPYIIHADEYFNDELGLTQSTVTYYQADDVLVDENDAPIQNHANIVGELRFGHGSNDKNVVYIRNEKRKTEYEVLLSTDSYEKEVLGHEYEDKMEAKDLKHSSHHRFQME